MFSPYNTQNMYQQRLNSMEQPFAQPIQTIQSQPPQAICYFVNSKNDLQNIQVNPNVVYIGINKQAKEIYMRCWTNDGVIDFDTYSLVQGEKENTELKSIMEKLDLILKEKNNEWNVTKYNSNDVIGSNAKQSNDGIVSANDGRKNKRPTDANTY